MYLDKLGETIASRKLYRLNAGESQNEIVVLLGKPQPSTDLLGYYSDTGLMYYRARFYDAQLGRFISEDPIGFSGGINPYAYVENNPLRFTDPSGLCSQNPEEKKDPCAEKVLTHFNLRDDSGKLNPYINSRAAPDFLAALLEINQAIPGGIAFSRAFRTRREQEDLYARRFSNPNPVAVPGTSRHESGFAVDVSGIVQRTAGGGYARDNQGNYIPTALGKILIPIFARHGFEWGAKFRDPPHFDADPTRYGYKSRAEAIAAASSYYANCIGGNNDAFHVHDCLPLSCNTVRMLQLTIR